MHRRLRGSRTALPILCGALLLLVTATAPAQVELLRIDDPATAALVRLSEYGALPDFPREHLPISRGRARVLLESAAADAALPGTLRELAIYHLVALDADREQEQRSLFIPVGDSDRTVYEAPFASRPIAIMQWGSDSIAARVVLEPLLDGELRVDPGSGRTALIAQGGAQLRGTVLERIGFAARVTNGSIAGDSAIAARDARIARAGAFGIAGYGRDVDYATGHLRADWSLFAVEIAREPVQLGGGLERSLLVGSTGPSTYDYLRVGLNAGPFSFSHLHGAILPDIDKSVRGAGALIPSRYVAAHLLTLRVARWMRVSLGESVIYSGRPFEIGYLNPFAFLRSQEHTQRDRDNANMYASLAAAPFRGLLLEAELMLDDLRFSRIGEGYWANKTAVRVAASARAVLAQPLDFGLSYTRLEPYMYTHFSETNRYTHDVAPLAGGGLPPNSHLVLLTAGYHPLPNLGLRASFGLGEHGANVMEADSIVRNVGGDVRYTRRIGIDSDTVSFLDGRREAVEQFRVELEYEPLRNVFLRLVALSDRLGSETLSEARFGIRVGAH